MALLAPRRTLSSSDPRLLRRLGWRSFLLLTMALAASEAQAQVTVGGNHPPDVMVDQGVLDQLGPAPTLPQLFGAHGADSRAQAPQVHPAAKAQRTATKAKKSTKSHKAVHHKTHHKTPRHKAPASRTASKSRSAIHTASHPKTAAKAPSATESHESKPASPTPPSIAIDSPPPPAPLPAAPQPIAVPAPPVVPPAPPPHVEAPGPGGAPLGETRADSPPTPLVPTPAVASTAKADAAVAAKPAAAQAAAVHVASVASAGHALNAVKFAPGATELPPGGQPLLDALAARLLANDSLRVQLIAHATGGTDEAMEARRVSLARAVAVRAYLIGKGVRSLRMDVRALGNHPGEGPVADEVDLMVVTQ